MTIVAAEPTLPQTLPTQNEETAAAEELPETDAPSVIISKDPSPATPAISVNGVVVDENGQPMSGMHVVLRGDVRNTHQYSNGLRNNPDILARKKSDSNGRFAFVEIGIPPRMIDVITKLRGGTGGAQLVVWGDGRAVTFEPLQTFHDNRKQIPLSLEADVSGMIVDGNGGNPLNGAVLTLSGLTAGTSDLSAFLDDPGDENLSQSEIQFRAVMHNGRFSLHHMPRDMRLLIHCEGASGERGFFLIDTGANAFTTITYRNGGGTESRVHRTPVRANVKQQPWIRIRVLDHEGKPVKGGGVEAVDDQGHYGGQASVGDDGIAVLIVNNPGAHTVGYYADPLQPAVGVQINVDIAELQSDVVEMRLPDSRWLTGKVLDADFDAPVTGVYVCFFNPAASKANPPIPLSAIAVSDAEGIFRLPVVPGEWNLRVRHEIDGYLTSTRVGQTFNSAGTTVTVTENNVPDDVIIKVARGLEVRGKVTDSDGAGLPNVTVLAENEDRPYNKASAVTNKLGLFTLSGLSPMVATRVSTWTDQGAAKQTIEGMEDSSLDQTVRKNIVLKVEPGTTLTGRVVQNGKTIAGINVKLLRALPWHSGEKGTRFRQLHEAVTDAEGRYRLTGLHRGDRYRLEVEVTGTAQVRDWRYQSPYSNTMNADDGETIELPDARLVSHTQELRGIVVAPDGTPAPGFTVWASLATGGDLARPQRGSPPWAETDKDGKFLITNLPDEQILLKAYRANLAGGRIHYTSKQTVELNAHDIRIVFDPKPGSGIEDLDAP